MRLLLVISLCAAALACVGKIVELVPQAPCDATVLETDRWRRISLAPSVTIGIPGDYERADAPSAHAWVAPGRGMIVLSEADRGYSVTDSTVKVVHCSTRIADRLIHIATHADYGHWGPHYFTVATWEETPGVWIRIFGMARDSLTHAEQISVVHTLRR